MTTIEDRVREMGAAVTPPTLPSASEVMRRGRQRRRRRRGVGLAAAVVIGSTGGLALRALASDDDESMQTTAPGRVDPSDSTGTGQPGTTPNPPGTRVVPDVVGLTVAEALPVIEELGLSVTVPSGSDQAEIVAQEPGPGVSLHVGGAVTLDVADLDRPAGVDGSVIRGALLDGRTWTVGYSTRHGLCVTLGPSDLGCDDVGPVIAQEADPATPRRALDETGSPYPGDEAGALAYAFLPPGAETVELVHDDGRRITAGLVIEPTQRFWAMPIRPGDNPDSTVYRDASGLEITRFPRAG